MARGKGLPAAALGVTWVAELFLNAERYASSRGGFGRIVRARSIFVGLIEIFQQEAVGKPRLTVAFTYLCAISIEACKRQGGERRKSALT